MEKRIPQAILLPRTEDSFPWGAADRQLVPTYLEKYGYEEEEYLYSGEADVYTLKDGQAQVKLSNAPYTNRFIIRKPKDPKKFSGNVVVELLNSTNSWDVSPMWCLLWQKMLHEGDIYVGVTVRAICTKTLKQYDTKRYEEIVLEESKSESGAGQPRYFTVAALSGRLRGRSVMGYVDATGKSVQVRAGYTDCRKRSGEDLCDQLFAVFHAVIYLYQCIP